MTTKTTQQPSAVALGIFDGIHKGHRNVLSVVINNKKSFVPAVFTFKTESMPFKSGKKLEYIYTEEIKEKTLTSLGIQKIFSGDFHDIKSYSGEEFCKIILKDYFNASMVSCGAEFRFGRNASCGIEDLREYGKKYNFDVVEAERIYDGKEKISSSVIREHLFSGNISAANRLLGENYKICGTICKGKQLGRTIGFPTVNQYFKKGQLIPAYGAYTSYVIIDGKKYNAITNIGVKPTVTDENIPLAETYIIDFSGDLYGKYMEIFLEEFIRGEKKFESFDALKEDLEILKHTNTRDIQKYRNLNS